MMRFSTGELSHSKLAVKCKIKLPSFLTGSHWHWRSLIMVLVEVTIDSGYVTPQQKKVTCPSYRCFRCRDVCRPRLFRPLFGYYAEKEQCNCTKYLLIFLCKYYLFLLKLGEML
uniref:Uncharacterized protein n=1 Tax=Ananas comosus var. bracteatus TaxID=296719 RepID=A0A6V7P960_ANACO|nr:unnamed protein product [Ananas comosus var. bracteatus]